MSDLFWDQIPNSYRDKIVDVIADTPQHQYQVLTKRPELMLKYSRRRQLPPNFWAGVTIESGRLFEGRIQLLRQVDVPIRFLSAEPLLSPYPDKLDLSGVHWVITGGESGTHLYDRQLRERRALVDYADNKWTPRPSRVEWVRQIRDACQCQGVAFFHKQWGGARPKSAGSKLDGRKWHEYPQFDTTAA